MLNRAGKEINLIINSDGGDAYHGFAIYDAIKLCSVHVKGIVIGMACSAASYILQACDERVMTPHSVFMIHYGTSGYNDNHPKIVRAWSEFEKQLDSKMEKA